MHNIPRRSIITSIASFFGLGSYAFSNDSNKSYSKKNEDTQFVGDITITKVHEFDPYYICGFDEDPTCPYTGSGVVPSIPPIDQDPVIPLLTESMPIQVMGEYLRQNVSWSSLFGDTIREKNRHLLARIEEVSNRIYNQRQKQGLEPKFGNRIIVGPELVRHFMNEKGFEPDPSLTYPYPEGISRVGRFHGKYIYRDEGKKPDSVLILYRTDSDTKPLHWADIAVLEIEDYPFEEA
jgi:hypothetical protein